jgi:outer membrane protein assembly factor BamB
LAGCHGSSDDGGPGGNDDGGRDGGRSDMAAGGEMPDLLPPPDMTPPPPRPAVLTQHNNTARTGAMLEEKVLTPKRVQQGFGKLFQLDVDDEVYAQPLYQPDVMLDGQGKHDVLFVATVNNSLYAFDAVDGTQLWKVSLGGSGVPVRNTDVGQACGTYRDYSGNIGTVGTPVIDPVAGTIYAVARTKEPAYTQRLHAIAIRDGSERSGSPVLISATTSAPGGAPIKFDARIQNQRAALLLSGGAITISWSAHCDTGKYHGWTMAYDAKTLEQVGVWNSTPRGASGGIWQSGGGPLADAGGNVYVAVGNGDTDGTDNFGQSLVRLMPRTLSVTDWFTPSNFQDMNDKDLDFGSGGSMIVPGTDLIVTGAKSGELFIVHSGSMGKMVSGDVQIVQKILVHEIDGELTNHLHGGPVFWKGQTGSWLYVWSENDYLRAYAFDGERLSDEAVSQSLVKPAKGMPGGMLAISANGTKDGILWATHPTDGDANQAVRHGILRAFDATDVSQELWNSSIDPADDLGMFAKFAAPTVVDGRVYLATFSGRVMVYGPK